MRVIAAVLSLFALQILAGQRLRQLESAGVEIAEESLVPWNPELFRLLSVGYLPASVDWLWIKVLQDPALHHVPKGKHAPIYFDLDLATELDPAFFNAYVAGANLLSVVRDDNIGARDLLIKGEKFRREVLPTMPERFQETEWGQEWIPPFILAYVQLFELNDLPRASEAYQASAAARGAPPYVKSIASRLSKPEGVYEVGERVLTFMAEGATNDKVRQELVAKLQALGVSKYLFQTNRSFSEFRQKKKSGSDETAFNAFLAAAKIPAKDPWGGSLSLNDKGRIETTTPHPAVFGVE